MRLFKDRTDNRFLIVGLGNPGKKYRMSRHNIGFEAVDYLAKEYGIKVTRSRFSSLTGEGRIGRVSVVMIKPMTYMNLSGEAVASASSYYNIPNNRILVLCDDVALEAGVIRIRSQGSSGGQKGLLSIEDMLETTQFMRLRIGVGHPVQGELKDYVLSIPTANERILIQNRFDDICRAVKMIIEGDLNGAQSLYNGVRVN